MVARTPTKGETKLVVLNSNLVRETVKKVDRAMARLQELQYAVTGGNKVISGVTLSPRSTRGYIRTSMRCKQESLRIRNSTTQTCSTSKIGPCSSGEWRRMSLPAMLVGETVGEILQASRFAKDAVDAVSEALSLNKSGCDDPKTPITAGAKAASFTSLDKRQLQMKRKREKQKGSNSGSPGGGRSPTTTTRRKSRSRISFRLHGAGNEKELCPSLARRENHSVQRFSPRGRPWAGKAVLFPNPMFLSSSPSSSRKPKFACKTRSPGATGNRSVTMAPGAPAPPPHKFAIKSPSTLASKFTVKIRSPPVSIVSIATPARTAQKKNSPPRPMTNNINMPRISKATKLRLSLSPSKFAKRLASPLKIISPSVRRTKSPTSPTKRFTPSKKKSMQPAPPPRQMMMMMMMMSTTAKLRRSLSPSNLAKRFDRTTSGAASTLKNPNLGIPVAAIGTRPSCCTKQRPVGDVAKPVAGS